jgi:hypothetical protein
MPSATPGLKCGDGTESAQPGVSRLRPGPKGRGMSGSRGALEVAALAAVDRLQGKTLSA